MENRQMLVKGYKLLVLKRTCCGDLMDTLGMTEDMLINLTVVIATVYMQI